MPLWQPTDVDDFPHLDMAQWMLIETHLHEVHVVGYNQTEREGRVSSPLVEFDVGSRQGTTRSGRRYRLCGNPGHSLDAGYVFQAWLAINRVTEWTDVTARVLALGLPPQDPSTSP
jgi:hypothetical protein